jgi:hypothetical protein
LNAGREPGELAEVGSKRLRLHANVRQDRASQNGAANGGERVLRPRQQRRRGRAAHALQRHQDFGHNRAAVAQRLARGVLLYVQLLQPGLDGLDLLLRPTQPLRCRDQVGAKLLAVILQSADLFA